MTRAISAIMAPKFLILAIVLGVAALFTSSVADASGPVTIGEPLVARPFGDGAQTTFVYKVGFGTAAVGHDIDTWGIYAGPATTGRSVTPLLLEGTGGNDYVLRAIGQTRTIGSGGMVTGVNAGVLFNTVAGSPMINNANYYFGWKDGTQTSSNIGVIMFDQDGPSNIPGPSLRYAALNGNSSQNITGANIGSTLSFGNNSLWARRYSLQATATSTVELKYTIDQGAGRVEVEPLLGSTDVETFYSYGSPVSVSANTGLEQDGASILFLHEDQNGETSLVAIHGKGSTGNGGTAVFNFSNNRPAGMTYVVKDDGNEASLPTSNWRWVGGRTDGGALRGGLDSPFEFTVSPVFSGLVDSWKFLDGSANPPTEINLNKGSSITIRLGAVATVDNPPTLDLPADITGVEATGPGGAAVNYTATASDDEDGTLTPSCNPASGSTFALGTTAVNCSVTDSGGNTVNGSFDVTVVDTTQPIITSTVTGTFGDNGWYVSDVTVSYAASDNGSGIDAGASDLSDDVLSTDGAGQSATGTAIDLAGNSASATASSIDIDQTAPDVTAPADQVVQTGDPSGAPVTFAPAASDGTSGLASVTSSPASGSTFPVGTTTVTHTATDNAGNSSTATHKVTVELVLDIDIKPGSDVNPLNLNGNGVVPVAILGSEVLNVTTIDVSTVNINGSTPAHSGHIKDVNDDGIADLMVHLMPSDFGIDTATPGGTVLTLTLTGELNDGTAFSGQDDVRINENNESSKGKGGKGPK